jgi:hypothetical protein
MTDTAHLDPANASLSAPPSAIAIRRNTSNSRAHNSLYLQHRFAGMLTLASCLVSHQRGVYLERRGVGVTAVGAHLGPAAGAFRLPKLEAVARRRRRARPIASSRRSAVEPGNGTREEMSILVPKG